MSNGPPGEPQSTERRNRRRLWMTTGLTLGAISTLGVAGGALWAWFFVNERLSPWASEQLSDNLNRPVSLGEVERASLTGVRFGPSAMPPTEGEPDELFVEAVEVRVNPLQLITRTLTPTITFVNPVAYVEQNEQGEWISFDFDEEDDEDEDKDLLIQISPTIIVEAGEVTALPYSADASAIPLTVGAINGDVFIEKVDTADFRNQDSQVEAQEISFDFSAEPEEAGMLEVSGVVQQPDFGEEASPETEGAINANVAIQAQQLDLAVLLPILFASLPQDLPLSIPSGLLDANLDVEVVPQAQPSLTGTARLTDGELFVDALATPFTNISTRARLLGDRVALEDTTANYGEMSAIAEGTIDFRNGYDLKGEIAPVEVNAIADAFNFEFPITAEGTLRAEDVRVTGPLAQPSVSGRVLATDVTTLDKVQFASLSSQVTYAPGSVTLSGLEAEPLAGGRLTGDGSLNFTQPPTLDLLLTGRNLPADVIARPYGLPENFEIGTIALDADISGPLSDLNGVVSWDAPGGTYPTRGTAEVAANTVRVRNAEIAGGTLSGTGTLVNRQWTADVAAQGLQLGVFNPTLAGITAGGDVRLAGSTDDFSLSGIRGDGDITTSLRGGTLNSQVALANGAWNANVQTRDFPISQFVPDAPINAVTADARLSGTVDNFSPDAIQGDGTASAAIAGGTLTSNFILANGTWQADGRTTGIQLGQLATDLQGTGEATFQLAGNLNNLTPAGIQGRANIRLSDGLATAAAINPNLAQVRSPLEVNLAWDGRLLQVNSLETAGLSANGIITPDFASPGAPSIAAIDLNIAAEDYALAALPVALPPVVGLQGQADFRGRLTGTPSNLNLDGDLALANLALNDLVFDPLLSGDVNFSSQTGLAVNLQGDEDEIVVNYDIATRDVDFSVIATNLNAVDPITGEAVAAIAAGSTEGDLLETQLYNFPLSILNIPPANSEFGSLRGQVQFANATVNLSNLNTVGQFRVENLGLSYYTVDSLTGGFSYMNGIARLNEGQFTLSDRDERGAITATRAYNLSGRYSTLQAPQFLATLSTEEGELRDIFTLLKIQDLADFRRGLTPEDGFIPSSQAEAEAVLATTPAGDPDGSLLSQLRRLAEIRELLLIEERGADQEIALPPLNELEGSFEGEIEFAASLPSDIAVDFDISGDSWRWGPDLSADSVIAQGRYNDGLVTLSPVQFSSQIEAETASIALRGEFAIDPEEQRNRVMNLEVVNVPIDEVKDFANLPFDLGGRLNGTAELRGRLADPNVNGSLQIANGTLNGAPIQDAAATLSYVNARAGLDAELTLVDSDDPITLTARVPYRFNFVEVEPTDQRYSIEANVKDEGFALLNLFTRQIQWESGEGSLLLNLEGDFGRGFLNPEKFDGLMLLEGATVSVRSLPGAPITNLTGRVRLVREDFLVVVDEVTGQFSEGQIFAQGTFPLLAPLEIPDAEDASIEAEDLSEPDEAAESTLDVPEVQQPDLEIADAGAPNGPGNIDPEPIAPAESSLALRSTPLVVTLENIALASRELYYAGAVEGQVQVGGSLVTGPALSGEIDLANGTITIPEGSGQGSGASLNQDDDASIIQPLRFDNLRIALQRNVNVVLGGFLDVNARGGLRVDGTINNLIPTGDISLPSGRVGLFGVTLRLAGDNDRAEFRRSFDPILDVTLQTSLPDASNLTTGLETADSPFPRNEVADRSIGNIGLTQQGNRLVRINAQYTGPASRLSDLTTDPTSLRRNLRLTSSPARSEQEIITLLSGNVIGALGAIEDGDNALTGIGTFLGSALLSTVRDFLGDTVPLSEFRIFQVTEGSGDVNDSEDIGGEIGVDISSNISVSVLKVLTNDTPFQFNVRYRLSDEFTVRGTTSYEDFNDRTGVLLEYETRF